MTGDGSYLRIYFLKNHPNVRGKGRAHAPYRYVLNSLLYILITACRWCDLPHRDIWASKSSFHRWLRQWLDDGTFKYIQGRVLAITDEKGLINWDFGLVDGSFSRRIGRW
ncbi:transposase [Nostoc flagelliforme]|uniref:transposase n=1 Tax=Nostoc flagelliforme TaxID=1306274 RepID=UPI0018EF93A5